MKKYLVIGGDVLSLDGDYHYISPRTLCKLYKVSPAQCHFMTTEEDGLAMRGFTQEYKDNLIVLRPRRDGNYKEAIREMELR